MPRKSSGVEKSKNENNTSFEVYINKGEIYQIQEWVLKHKNIETGGDLFGLWLDDHTAVVQFVLGPGKKCRRTATSFFQDVQYLQEAGSYLTDKHGLCNIGQWHSHHQLSLSKPSHGDENTVWGNMPVLGLNRYIVFIANITNEVTVNCFLFHYQGRKRSLKRGQFKYLHGNSPLRLNEMVLQNTFNGLESFTNPAMFEREMKFLRNNNSNEDNIEVSTRDKEQNVEHEISTTPKMKELENLNTKSPQEQPRETGTFESQRLRDNDAKNDENCGILIKDNTETYTGTKEQFSTNTPVDDKQNKNSPAVNISVGHEQNNRNIARCYQDEKDNLRISNEDNNENYTILHNNAKDNVNILNKDNVRNEIENMERPNTHIFTAHEQHSDDYLRPDNNEKDNPDTFKNDIVETCTANISVGHEQNDGSISNEDDNETYTGNKGQYDASISVTQERPTKNSLQRNDAKDSNDILKNDVRTFTENTEQYDISVSVKDGQHNRNSLGPDDTKYNSDTLKKDNIETCTGNAKQYDTGVSVGDGQHGRNSFRPEKDAKGNGDILKDDKIETSTANTERYDSSSFNDHGKSKITKTAEAENHRATMSCEQVTKVNNGPQTKKPTAGTHETVTVENLSILNNDDVFTYRNDIGTFKGNIEQSNSNIPVEYGKYKKNSLDNVTTSIVNKEQCGTSDEHEQYHKKESPQKLVIEVGHIPGVVIVILDGTRGGQNFGQHSPSTARNEQTTPLTSDRSPQENNHEVRSNTYEQVQKEKKENYNRKSLPKVKTYHTPETEKANSNPSESGRNATQLISRRGRGKVTPSTQIAPSTSDRGGTLKNTYEPNLEGRPPRRSDQVLENEQTLQHQLLPIQTTGYRQKSEHFSNTSPGAQDLYTKTTAKPLERIGVSDKFSGKRREYISDVDNERSMHNPVSQRYTLPTQKSVVTCHVNESGNEIVTLLSEKRGSGQYDNVINSNELSQHDRSPNPKHKLPKSENQATIGETPNVPTRTIRAKENRHEGKNEKKGDKANRNNMPLGHVNANNTSHSERGQHIGHVNNENSMSKPVSPFCTRQPHDTVVRYHGHESGYNEKRGSGQYDNVINSNELSQHERSPNSDYKLLSSKNQAAKDERPNTPSDTIKVDENHREIVQDTKRGHKTKTKKTNCFATCFGRKSGQISDEPYSVPEPEAKQKEEKNKRADDIITYV